VALLRALPPLICQIEPNIHPCVLCVTREQNYLSMMRIQDLVERPKPAGAVQLPAPDSTSAYLRRRSVGGGGGQSPTQETADLLPGWYKPFSLSLYFSEAANCRKRTAAPMTHHTHTQHTGGRLGPRAVHCLKSAGAANRPRTWASMIQWNL
jgi:hypothetical protein